jgi:PAS domain S-box-containing protein
MRYREEVQGRVATRALAGFAVLVMCAAFATVVELLRFPERRAWMMAADAAYVLVAAGTLALLRVFPLRSVGITIVAVNVLGVILNLYHVIVGAEAAVCLWTLTGLLASAALFLGWGWRPQLLASLGAVAGYTLLLRGDASADLAWVAGGVYLAWVVGLSALGAELIDQYLAKQFELACTLSERESRLQSYFDLSLVGTAILSRERGLLEVNEELCRILDYRAEDLLRARWLDLVPFEAQAADRTQFAPVLGGVQPAAFREGELLRRDGTRIHASISVRALPGPLGEVDHLIVVVQDMTQRRRAEREREQAHAREQTARREAEAASHAKDEFLAVASHELRTPLTPILAWVPMIRSGRLDADEERRARAAHARRGRRLVQLIDDLLDVSRIVSGKLRLAMRPADVEPIVHAAVESMRPAADAKGVGLELRVPTAPAYVSGDPDRLQQVVWNLVSNGIKFTDPGGRVEVDIVHETPFVAIRVRDNGRGIGQDVLPHVFDPFWQADCTTTRRHGGLGLGLAIVRHLVEAHGGTVAVASEGRGQGAVFTVRLPAVTAAPAIVERRASNGPAPRALRGIRVLVVDDEADALEVARRVLELSGVEVRTAGNTREAMAILEGWVPTVLVSDIAMPDEDGYTLIRRVRGREATGGGHVPALAFTALARAEDRSRVLAAGFDGYVAKPVEPAEFLDAVAAAAAAA